MASPRPWPFHDDDDRPSGSVRPLSLAELQAIVAHLGDDPTSCWPAPVRIGRWWRSGYGRQWAGRAAQPRQAGASNEQLSGRPGPGRCPGESPSSSGWVPPVECSAAYWRPGWD
jgi:hypothetical protein